MTASLSAPFGRLTIWLALLGAGFQVCGMVVSALAYNDSNIEPYSCLNHFISELGWPARSYMAWMYNTCLMVGSVLFVPLIFSLASYLGTRLGYVAAIVGLGTVLAASAVGYFPIMKHLAPHLMVAFGFFVGWGLTSLLFALCLLATSERPLLPIAVSLGGFFMVAVFLIYPKGDLPSVLKMLKADHRPTIWWPAILEWCVLISFYMWVLSVAFLLRSPASRTD